MTPKQTLPLSDFDLYRSHFNQILNQRHELILLGRAIDWSIPSTNSGHASTGSSARCTTPRTVAAGCRHA